MAKWEAAGYGSQLRAVLGTPEMVALLTAAPQAVAILRPLCRALGIETSVLRPWVVVAPGGDVVPPKPVTPRVRKKRVPIDWGRIPLPRGTMAAVRRYHFGKLPKPW